MKDESKWRVHAEDERGEMVMAITFYGEDSTLCGVRAAMVGGADTIRITKQNNDPKQNLLS